MAGTTEGAIRIAGALVGGGLALGGGAIGAVAGLVIFQLLFVVNVGRIVMSQGIQ